MQHVLEITRTQLRRTRYSQLKSVNKKDEQKDQQGLISAPEETQIRLIYDVIKVS